MISTLRKLALTAVLVAGVAGTIGTVPAAHAAQQVHSESLICIPCVLAPTLTASASHGTVFISGRNWPANSFVEVDVYMPVYAGGAVTQTWAFTDSSGKFSTTWYAPGFCFWGQVEVQAYNAKTVDTTYVTPGCIG